MENFISTDRSKLDVELIHQYICNESYWGLGRTLEKVQNTIEHSLCFGIYLQDNQQVGFGRIVTDYTFFGNIMDVFVIKEYQGQGFGKKLIDAMMNNEIVKKLNTIALKTKDAHGLYEDYGFKSIGDSALWMVLDKQKLT